MPKQKIPKALREQVWLKHFGKKYEFKCSTHWCANIINVFDFHCGHDIPECHGGATTLVNLYPICARCNLSMGSQYTFAQWNAQIPQKRNCFSKYFCSCIKWQTQSSVMKANGTKSKQNPTSPSDRHLRSHG